VSEAVSPDYTFLVIDAMTGQDAVTTAKAFHDTLDLDGVILTKLDGDARGGAALSVKHVVGRPIAFASTGERLGDFDLFHPDRMADRILGMGDVLSLIEQAEREVDQDVAKQGAARLLQGRFTLEDFLAQLQQVKKMGSLGGLLSLLPGMPKEIRQAKDSIDDSEVAQIEAIIRSMTPAERDDPSIVDGSRRLRIAQGSGTDTQDVNALLKQFKEAQAMLKSPGALGSMLGMSGGKFEAALASLKDEADGLDDLSLPAAGAAVGGSWGGARAQQSRAKGPGGKKKKGGRVTPKGGGGGR
jgi:signal recognition particle subunit SRP54